MSPIHSFISMQQWWESFKEIKPKFSLILLLSLVLRSHLLDIVVRIHYTQWHVRVSCVCVFYLVSIHQFVQFILNSRFLFFFQFAKPRLALFFLQYIANEWDLVIVLSLNGVYYQQFGAVPGPSNITMLEIEVATACIRWKFIYS